LAFPPAATAEKRATALDVHDAIHDFVVDAVAAHGNDQRSPGCCCSGGKLVCVACVTRGLQGNRHVRQPATKIIPYALGKSTGIRGFAGL
jgi:hypothetical protein